MASSLRQRAARRRQRLPWPSSSSRATATATTLPSSSRSGMTTPLYASAASARQLVGRSTRRGSWRWASRGYACCSE
eukprot:scaffold33319_cov48-Phaeocystis_antarctica.AAC.1